mgnify:CR=1 FL=1
MIVIIARQDAPSIALGVVILTRAERPEKRNKPNPPEQKRDGDQIDKDIHDLPLRRSALSDTVMELSDIARAAANGVANPAKAIGMAIML